MIEAASQILREAAATFILPRYRKLKAQEISLKAANETVTVADLAAEAFLTARLLDLLPDARAVGEEAASRNPALLNTLERGTVWLVDPLDGTTNFADGREPFAVMVALLREGETVASWMLEAVSGQLAVAERGAGAFLDGVRVIAPPQAPAGGKCSGFIATRFMPDSLRDAIEARKAALGLGGRPSLCAAADYVALATGKLDFACYWRSLVWDHAPGSLFLTEAGGIVARLDGRPYRAAEDGAGLLAARDRHIWNRICEAVFSGSDLAMSGAGPG